MRTVLAFNVCLFLCSAAGSGEYIDSTTRQFKEGIDALVVCNATVSPDVDIYWTKHGHEGVYEKGPKLQFNNISRLDSGNYECHSVNVSNPADNQTVEIVYIDVLYPAMITKFSVDNTSPMENSSVRIICNIEGNPSPVWELRNNLTNELMYRGNTSQYLDYTIKAVGCEESGLYMCTGFNNLNYGINITREQNVTVRCAPRPNPNAPGDYKVYAFVGIDVIFFENVIGYPYPNYTWSRADGKPMGTVQKSSYPSFAVLNISDIKTTDFGQYILVMTNAYGAHTSTFSLIQYNSHSTTPSHHGQEPSNKSTTIIAGSVGGGALAVLIVAMIVAYNVHAKRKARVSSNSRLLN